MTEYTRTFHEVHTSEDNKKWYRHGTTEPDTEEGLAAVSKRAGVLSASTRYVRVVHITKKVKILTNLENREMLSRDEINTLLAAGKDAIAGVPGLSCNEGFAMSFDKDLSHGPTTVTIQFYPESNIGKRHTAKDKPLYDILAAQLRKEAFDKCCRKLDKAGVKYLRGTFEIKLQAQ